MRQRREIWSKLSKEGQNFVIKYLQENLGLNESEFENFLFPDFEKTILSGKAIHDMERAVERILRAIEKGERICVYGDYDCDGVPGTALLRDFFEKINYHNVIYYIPHRHTEGYGLNKTAISKIHSGNFEEEIADGEVVIDANISTDDITSEKIGKEEYQETDKTGLNNSCLEKNELEKKREEKEKVEEREGKNKSTSFKGGEKTKLLITIDLGTTNIEEIDFANELGIDVIITDHHLPLENEDGQILPKAYAIINNKKNNCNYTNKDLCGSGTLFKLVTEILENLRNIFETKEKNKYEKVGIKLPQKGYEKWLLDLVAIATIADMVPLTHENRTLSIYGLYVLSKTNRVGLQTLFKNAKTDLVKVNETDIAFTIAPRINSASRMAHPKIALSMFSQNLEEGIGAAHELEELNTSRKETTKNIVKKIYKILDERIENSKEKKLPEIVVIGSSDWNAGILGILASKVLEKYNVNVFVFGQDESDEKKFKGSCRSRGDIHLVKLMTATKEMFLHFGGHELAGGFSLSFENLHLLETELNKNIKHARIENLTKQKKEDSKNNFIKISLHEISNDLLNALNLIGPFGVGNPKPIFKIENVLETRSDRFGKSKEHLKLKLTGVNFSKNSYSKKIEIEAIKFFVEKEEEEKILELHKNRELFFEIEPGWMSGNPRLRIIL